MKNFLIVIKAFLDDDEGVTAIEYGLIAALIAVAIAITLGLLGEKLDEIYAKILTELSKALGGGGA